MQHVVGTAGHVDHGKSSLVRALTGVDPDRLAEEKRRGMTIELGFAAWTLPSGRRVGIVDVPGHRRFVRTMVAGAQGIDLVLLVVAADEGVMPQTREHLAICELLGARHAVVALTKSDSVDAETLQLAESEVAELLSGSALAGAPSVACSSISGEGLDTLARTVDSVLDGVPARLDRGRPRLFVDRAFSMAGFGPVVTGTLEGGVLSTGDEVVMLPAGLRARIRGLQNHGSAVASVEPGSRTAVNLSGVDRAELRRGMALAAPGVTVPTRRADGRLLVIAGAPHGVRHHDAVELHIGTAEVRAAVLLLDADELAPGERGFAQFEMEDSLPTLPGDRFVVRRAAEAATLGGGVILDCSPRRHRRRDPEVIDGLRRREEGGLVATVHEELRKRRLGATLATLLPASGAGAAQVTAALAALDGAVLHVGQRWMSAEGWEALRARTTAVIGAYHDQSPLRAGMPREEWGSRLRLGAAAPEVARALVAQGVVEENSGLLALPGRGRQVSPAARRAADAVAALLEGRGLDPPPEAELRAAGLTSDLLRLLIDEERVVRLGQGGPLIAGTAYRSARATIVSLLKPDGAATVAAIRDRLGATRRIVVPLLEHLEAERVTARSGDLHRLRG